MEARKVSSSLKCKSVLRTVIFVCVLSLVVAGAAGETWASTITVRADGSGDYPTIQRALDAAVVGDEVVLDRGTYAGTGNFNLNFRGKAVTLRSRNPDDNECMRNTIIDAQGEGVIIRFINDEGPGTVFEGFTLGAGDIYQNVRGTPGFFELSMHARPTTRRLRNKPGNPSRDATFVESTGLSSTYLCPGLDDPPDGRIWDGHNPFHQPANTTNYHGSGDLNLDGIVSPADELMLTDIINGTAPDNIRADLNGDGLVSAADSLLMTNFLNSGIDLPAWWNELTTTTQRNDWIDKFMTLDKTDKHIYTYSFFICHHFAYQTYIHGAFERDDFAVESTEFDAGQTVYNVPLYWVGVTNPSHAINGILVGDDPLNFDDWRFLEPQNDSDVVPGGWNMLFGTSVNVGNPYNTQGYVVSFLVEETGWTLEEYSPDMVLTRPAAPVVTADNRKDYWHPVIVPHGGTGLLFFEKMREDMTRTTDIHVTDVSVADYEQAVPVAKQYHFSRLLDVTRGPDGAIHVLFESKSAADLQNLFHGIYDPVNQIFNDVSQVAEDLRLPAMGRIEVMPSGEIFVFWFENYGFSGTYEIGIHWTKSTGMGWQAPTLLTGELKQQQTGNWANRQFAWYAFDTEVLDDGRLLLVFVEMDSVDHYLYLSQFVYDGSWTGTQIENTGWNYGAQGVRLCRSTDGTIHLGYWRAREPSVCYDEGDVTRREGRGDVYHRTFDGVNWAGAVRLDNTMKADVVDIAAGPDNKVYMIWERRIDDTTVSAVWNRYEDGIWSVNTELPAAPGFDVWYPTVSALQDGRVIAAWSARDDDLVTIETVLVDDPGTEVLPISFIGDFDGDLKVNLVDFAPMASAWQSQPGNPNWNSLFDVGIPPDDEINLDDLGMFCSFWLSEPFVPEYFEENFETGDFSRHDWQHIGDASWRVVSNEAIEGVYSAKSGLITHSQQSTLQIQMNIDVTQIVFSKKVSSEKNWDYLRFYIDGTQQGAWSGNISWSQESFSISPGQHTFTWTYEKDYSISSGSDCAWIDDIRTE